MAKKAQPSLQASDAFIITPSDSGSIATDPGNPSADYTFCYPSNYGTAGIVYVTPVDAPDLTTTYDVPIYLAAGQTSDLMVKKVWATGLGAGVTLIAKITRGGSF
jgi:hypothetical protein